MKKTIHVPNISQFYPQEGTGIQDTFEKGLSSAHFICGPRFNGRCHPSPFLRRRAQMVVLKHFY